MNKHYVFIALALVAIFITIFVHWEPTHESWGYWLMARDFSENGGFTILDRSPLYVAYVALFRWIKFPFSFIAEYVLTTIVTYIAFVIYFRKYFGFSYSTVAFIAWLPFMLISEPPVQKLAFAFSLFGVALRREKTGVILSYSCFLIAYLFRSSYVLLILFFLFFDVMFYRSRTSDEKIHPMHVLAKAGSLSLILVLTVVAVFITNQSTSKWNNGWFASSEWFPYDGKKFEILQVANWSYIWNTYGSFKDKDFYFTNRELFGDVTTTIGALRVNPRYIFRYIVQNIPQGVENAVKLTGFYKFVYGSPISTYLGWILFVFLVLGSFGGARQRDDNIFNFSNLALFSLSIVFMGFSRYMFPMIVVFLSSSRFYRVKYKEFLDNPISKESKKRLRILLILLLSLLIVTIISRVLFFSFTLSLCFKIAIIGFFFITMWVFKVSSLNKTVGRIRKILSLYALPLLFLILFSNIQPWKKMLVDFYRDSSSINVKPFEVRKEDRNQTLVGNFNEFNSYTSRCRGAMSLEYAFLGAFTSIPLNKLYDVWEIPPFGTLGKSPYVGLNPKRVNCLFISNELESAYGAATNFQIRYDGYIKPYIEQLRTAGAMFYTIPHYGYAVIL